MTILSLVVTVAFIFAIGCEKEEQKTRISQNEIEQNRLKAMEFAVKTKKMDSIVNTLDKDSILSVLNMDSIVRAYMNRMVMTPPCTDCNKIDANGKKQGLWREPEGNGYTEIYYKDGLAHGVYKTYDYPTNLRELGELKEGEYTGNLYFFGDGRGQIPSAVSGIMRNIEKNTDIIIKCPDREIKFKYKTYSEEYHPTSGVLLSEGVELFDHFHENVFRYGTWKFYNEKGELIKTKDTPDYKNFCSVVE